MIDLDSQIQALIDDAPQDGTTPQLVSAIAPVLKAFAESLRHPQYYILQTLEEDWILTTIQHQTDAALEKTVLYAYPTLKDAAAGSTNPRDPQFMALPVSTIPILFQLTSLEFVDSVVFFEFPGDPNQGVEIQRQELQKAIQLQLQQKFQAVSVIPPNLA
jgi:hypothetical protein